MTRICWGVPEEIRDLLREIFREVTGKNYEFYAPYLDNLEKNLEEIEKEMSLNPGNIESNYLPEEMSKRLCRLLSRVRRTPFTEKEIGIFLWRSLTEMGYEPQRIKRGIRKVLYGL